MSYIFVLILSGIGLIELIGIFDAFRFDRFALFVSMFIDMPLGIILLTLSVLVKRKDEFKTKKRNTISVVGVFLGSLLTIFPPLLFWISSF